MVEHYIKDILSNFQLYIDDVVARCYDGAANMRGVYKGVTARIKKDNLRAIWIHCNGHILNLVLVDAATSVIAARIYFGTLLSCIILWKLQQKSILYLKKCKRIGI